MIKFLVLIKDDYNYSVIQLDLMLVAGANTPSAKDYYTVDRASYDARDAADKVNKINMGHHYYGSNRIWKVPGKFRGRHVVIDIDSVFDTRLEASTAAMKLVEDKVRNDILAKQNKIRKLEDEISNLSGKKLTPVAQFKNCSTQDLKKGKKKP